MLLSLEYISTETGIDNNDIKKLLTYEYTVITLPIVTFFVVSTNTIIAAIRNMFLIDCTRNQFLPCNVDP